MLGESMSNYLNRAWKQKLAAVMFVLFLFCFQGISSASSQFFYVTNSNYTQGMIMSLTPNPGVIEPSTLNNAKAMVGVVAPNDENSFSQQSGQISIRTEGEAEALVSTYNGNIIVGDKIAPSEISGVGENLSGGGWSIGTAQSSLDSTTKGAVKTIIGNRVVYVAAIPVLVKVSYVPAPYNQANSRGWIVSLSDIAKRIVGKQVSIKNIFFSILTVLLVLFIAGVIVNGAVRGGMLAIGRQPLTKSNIYRNMAESFTLAFLMIALGLVIAWLILRY